MAGRVQRGLYRPLPALWLHALCFQPLRGSPARAAILLRLKEWQDLPIGGVADVHPAHVAITA